MNLLGSRRVRRAVGVVALAATVGSGAVLPSEAGASAPETPDPKVVIVAAPRLTWSRLTEKDSPNLWRFAQESAVASMSVRTIGKITEPHEAYLTIGSGNRAGGVEEDLIQTWPAPGAVLNAGEGIRGRTAKAIHGEQTGADSSGAAAVVVDFPAITRANDEWNYGSKPGAMATALNKVGKSTAIIANADAVDAAAEPKAAASTGEDSTDEAAAITEAANSGALARQAGLAVADELGRISRGTVGPELLERSADDAFGLRLSRKKVAAEVADLLPVSDVLLLELSDLERAERAGVGSTDRQRRNLLHRAVRTSDELFGDTMAAVEQMRSSGTPVTVMLVGPTSPVGNQQLTVFAVQGGGFRPGYVQSASTRRPGIVTLTDLAPTILRELGVAVPKSMGDTPLEAAGARPSWSKTIDQLRYTNVRAVIILRLHDPLAAIFVAMIVLLALSTIFTILRRPKWTRFLKAPALFLLSVPAAAYLMGVARTATLPAVVYSLAIASIACLIAVAAHLIARKRAAWALVIVAGCTWLLLAVDVALGGWLQLDTIFGYSPIVAGRFAGFGNLSFALFAVTSLVLATIGLFGWLGDPEIDDTKRQRVTAGVLLIGLLAIIIDGAPMFGSDVGGVLSLVPAFGLLAFHTSGIRIRFWTLLGAGGAALVVLAGFAAIDLARPSESRTHLGRFVASVTEGDGGMILERKLHANLSLLTSSVWSMTIPAAFLLLAVLNFRPTPTLSRLQAAVPGFKAFGAATLLCGLTGMLVNDSGIAVPAMMFAFAIPGTIALVSDLFAADGAKDQG